MAQELFDIGNGLAIASNPGGRFHGWLFKMHPDGQYVSIRKLDLVANPFGSSTAFLIPDTQPTGECEPPSK